MQKRKLEECIKKIPADSLSNGRHSNYVPVSSFTEWARWAVDLKDPDQIRVALYYCFQPLFDAIIRGDLDSKYETASKILEEINNIGISYLMGYYLGQPNPKSFQNSVRELTPSINSLSDVSYQTKGRNIGLYNDQATPHHVAQFLKQCLINIVEGQLPQPDVIVGCACGSSELVMPLSGLVQSKLYFIRRSKRRCDDKPKIIKGQSSILKKDIHAAKVTVAEDFVCSGNSLYAVMAFVNKYEPKNITGISMHLGVDYNLTAKLDMKKADKSFQKYKLGRGL